MIGLVKHLFIIPVHGLSINKCTVPIHFDNFYNSLWWPFATWQFHHLQLAMRTARYGDNSLQWSFTMVTIRHITFRHNTFRHSTFHHITFRHSYISQTLPQFHFDTWHFAADISRQVRCRTGQTQNRSETGQGRCRTEKKGKYSKNYSNMKWLFYI